MAATDVTHAGAYAAVSVERQGSVTLVKISGDLDLAAAPVVRDVLARERAAEMLVLDLGALRFIDSAGLTLAVDEHRRAEEDGRTFVVAGAHGPVRQTFRMSGIDAVLRFADAA